jgi:hypothetical protein
MKIILGSNGSGKTKKMIEFSAANNVPILCESKARADRLLHKAMGYGMKIPLPIVFEEFDSSLAKEVCIDEINGLIEKVLKVKVSAFSINIDNIEDISDLDHRLK